jgi:hypothetical protein
MSYNAKPQAETPPPKPPALDDSPPLPKYNFSAVERALGRMTKRLADRPREDHQAV